MELKIQTHDDEIQVVLDTLSDELVQCQRIERENPELKGMTRAKVLIEFMEKVEDELAKWYVP